MSNLFQHRKSKLCWAWECFGVHNREKIYPDRFNDFLYACGIESLTNIPFDYKLLILFSWNNAQKMLEKF